MKIKTGFVSNSSTTSFLLFGGYEKENKIKSLIVENCPVELISETATKFGYTSEKLLTFGGRDLLDALVDHVQIYFEPYGWDEEIYFGFSPEYIPDKMTMGEWKAMISQRFDTVLGEGNVKYHFVEDAWRDD